MLYMFDVDGTLIEGFIRNCKEQGLAKQPEHHSEVEVELYDRVQLLPNRLTKISNLVQHDPRTMFSLVTNQAGVAFGFQTEKQVRAKMANVCAELLFFMRKPFSVHICYEHPKAKLNEYCREDWRRKPGPGMLHEAMFAHGVSLRNTLFVGDMSTDEQAAKAAAVPYKDAEEFFSP